MAATVYMNKWNGGRIYEIRATEKWGKTVKAGALGWTTGVLLQVVRQVVVVSIHAMRGRFAAICTMHGSYRVVQSCR